MRRLIGASSIIALAALLIFVPTAAHAAGCNEPGWTTTCSSQTDGHQVNVGGSQHSSGSNGGGTQSGGGSPGGGSAPQPEEEQAAEPEDCGPAGVLCRGGYSVGLLPDVTASDLASFVPAGPSFAAEPDGVGIVGMPANFVASASEQTLAGTLFDLPVTVRFVPAAYVFDFGDGSSARSASGGASWASLGQPQFTATPTSHAYGARGSYVASVDVEYAAAVDFGTGWRPVIGVVTAEGGAQGVDVYEARTALVDRTCVENPRGPGC